ncbi:hypothetical protein KC324_g77 [Hortaea werneckii]|nr:hypothetical protein KC324_g77 [Hortaea werneckii]
MVCKIAIWDCYQSADVTFTFGLEVTSVAVYISEQSAVSRSSRRRAAHKLSWGQHFEKKAACDIRRDPDLAFAFEHDLRDRTTERPDTKDCLHRLSPVMQHHPSSLTQPHYILTAAVGSIRNDTAPCGGPSPQRTDCASAVVVQRKFLLAAVDKMERCIAARRTMRPITSRLKALVQPLLIPDWLIFPSQWWSCVKGVPTHKPRLGSQFGVSRRYIDDVRMMAAHAGRSWCMVEQAGVALRSYIDAPGKGVRPADAGVACTLKAVPVVTLEYLACLWSVHSPGVSLAGDYYYLLAVTSGGLPHQEAIARRPSHLHLLSPLDTAVARLLNSVACCLFLSLELSSIHSRRAFLRLLSAACVCACARALFTASTAHPLPAPIASRRLNQQERLGVRSAGHHLPGFSAPLRLRIGLPAFTSCAHPSPPSRHLSDGPPSVSNLHAVRRIIQ